MANKVMPFDRALNFIGKHKIIVHYDNQSQVGLFTPGRPMPQDFKRGIYKHRQKVVNLMQAGDVRLCPAPELHQPYWHNERCAMCVQLDNSLLEANEEEQYAS